MGLSRLPAVHPSQMWHCVRTVKDMKNSGGGEGEEACFEGEWGGFGFGTGEEEKDDAEGVERRAC